MRSIVIIFLRLLPLSAKGTSCPQEGGKASRFTRPGVLTSSGSNRSPESTYVSRAGFDVGNIEDEGRSDHFEANRRSDLCFVISPAQQLALK